MRRAGQFSGSMGPFKISWTARAFSLPDTVMLLDSLCSSELPSNPGRFLRGIFTFENNLSNAWPKLLSGCSGGTSLSSEKMNLVPFLESAFGNIGEPLPNGKFLIDFNQAYNPYCAYAEHWSCPETPFENRLKIPIRAGEKIYYALRS